MAVVIFGASGLIGSYLRAHLASIEREVISVFRKNPPLPLSKAEKTVHWAEITASRVPPKSTLVILNGAPIAANRWTRAVKSNLRESRCDPLDVIARWIKTSKQTPERVLCSSAVGIYPLEKGRVWDEESPLGQLQTPLPFLQQLCHQWERAAQNLELLAPVTRLRFGNVLAPDGGLLQKLLPWFRRGITLQFGKGDQFLPWIHIGDVCRIISSQLSSTTQFLRIINCVAPNRIEQRTFFQTLGKEMNAQYHVSIPAFLLRWLLGERAQLLLEGGEIASKYLPPEHFAFSTLQAALADCCQSGARGTSNSHAFSVFRLKKTNEPQVPSSPLVPERLSTRGGKKIERHNPTQVIAKFDCGPGNQLYIRGEGAGLSWKKGKQLTNISANEWVWQSSAPFEACEFKILINDSHFELGSNHILKCGQSLCLTLEF